MSYLVCLFSIAMLMLLRKKMKKWRRWYVVTFLVSAYDLICSVAYGLTCRGLGVS